MRKDCWFFCKFHSLKLDNWSVALGQSFNYREEVIKNCCWADCPIWKDWFFGNPLSDDWKRRIVYYFGSRKIWSLWEKLLMSV